MHFICDDKCIYKSIWQVYIIISLTSIYILGIFYYHHMMWDWWVHTKYPFFFFGTKEKKNQSTLHFKKKKNSHLKVQFLFISFEIEKRKQIKLLLI